MRSTTAENIAEHSHSVAMISHAIAVIGIKLFGQKYDPAQITVYAVYHDCGEVLTGDLPTPVKYANPKLRAAYKELEDGAADSLLSMLPKEFRADFATILKPNDGRELEIVKAADKISAYIKCIEELKSGNTEFARAKKTIKASIDAINLPEVKYFMDNFVGAYELSLDEINN